jgi:hypothetical protein
MFCCVCAKRLSHALEFIDTFFIKIDRVRLTTSCLVRKNRNIYTKFRNGTPKFVCVPSESVILWKWSREIDKYFFIF